MGAQTLATIKATQPESLWHFIQQVPFSMEAQIFYGVVLFGVLGMLASYVVKWAQKQVDGSPIDYFLQDQVRKTVATLCTYIGAMAAGIGTGAFFTSAGDFVGWYNVAWASLTTSFAVDMGINKGSRPEWNEEERKAMAAKVPA